MKQQHVFTGVAKYLRLGSKGNRYKLIIDDIELSKEVQEIVEKNKAERDFARGANRKIPDEFDLQKHLRHEAVAVFIVEKK